MKFITLAEGLSLALVASTAAAANGPPPSWVGANPMPLPVFQPPPGEPAWKTQSHSAWPPHPTGEPTPTKGGKAPEFTLFTGEVALGYAVVSPINATGSDQGIIEITSTQGVNSTASLAALGQGGDGHNGTGPGSIASGIGAGSGSKNLTASANAASAAAILNNKATFVYLSTNASANSTTYNTTSGPVTISQAWSISEASDKEGDYAFYWAWAYSYISQSQNYTYGDNGGYTWGKASGGADHGGWYGWNGPWGGNGGSNDPNATGMAEYGRASATASAGAASVTVSANDPRQIDTSTAISLESAFADTQFYSNSTGGGAAISEAHGLGLPSFSAGQANAQFNAKPHEKAKAAAVGQPDYSSAYASAGPDVSSN